MIITIYMHKDAAHLALADTGYLHDIIVHLAT